MPKHKISKRLLVYVRLSNSGIHLERFEVKTLRYEKDCDCGWWSAKEYEHRAAVAAICRGRDAGRKMAEQ